MGRLDALDLTPRLAAHRSTSERLAAAQRRWLQLRLHLGGQMGSGELGPGPAVVFEGSDAAGKGGAIKRVVEPLDPRHYRVSSFAKPTFDEKRHPFLWRFYPYDPRARRDVGVRPQLVRAGARRAHRGLRHRRAVEPGVRGDRQLRADDRRWRA